MKYYSNWDCVELIPENEQEEKVLQTLWELLPEQSKKYYDETPFYQGHTFERKAKGDKGITFVTSN